MDAASEASASTAQLTAESFGQTHFGACEFGDARLTKRAVKTAELMMKHPGGTLPQKLNAEADLDGFYNFANNPKVNHDSVLTGHIQRTHQRMVSSPGVKLIIHDTTEGDYSGLDIGDLGPIGNGGCRGLLLHNVLAYDLDNGEALGLLGQFVHRRRRVRKTESHRAKREHPQRESRLWPKGVEAVGEVPEGQVWVNLMDRGGDSFECLDRQRGLRQLFVVRSKSNRRVRVLDSSGRWRSRKLHSWARRLATLATKTVEVAANEHQPARTARVRIAAGAVQLLPPPHPRRGEHGDEPLDLWIVHVKELQAPAGAEPLEWLLLTNVPTATAAEALERVWWYEKRPVIEEFHKAQKTGCGMELPQFTTRKALEVAIGMLSVVAVQLLRLRDLSRQPEAQTRPAREVVDGEYVRVLSAWRWKQARPDLSVWEFLYALAKLGGHLNRTHDHPPGWLVLWRGWTKLQLLVDGAAAGRIARCAET
jgi:Transposase DNA-binding